METRSHSQISMPHYRSLVHSCEQAEDELDKSLNIDIDDLDQTELEEHTRLVKRLYYAFSDSNSKLVQYCIDHGSITEANDHRKGRGRTKTCLLYTSDAADE